MGYIELTHESLLDHWDALKEWLSSGRDTIRSIGLNFYSS